MERAVFVADSGLLSKENIEKLQENSIEYIVGALLKSLSRQWQDTILDNRNHIKEQKNEDVVRYSKFKYDSNRA